MIYLRMDQSLGAAHWVAQWARWKTVWPGQQTGRSQSGQGNGSPHTLLDAVLLGLLGAVDALDAVVEVVLRRGALLGVLALCE